MTERAGNNKDRSLSPVPKGIPFQKKASSESRLASFARMSRRSSSESSAAASVLVASSSLSTSRPTISTTTTTRFKTNRRSKLHRSSTSAPSTPEGWWQQQEPTYEDGSTSNGSSSLWNDRYQMGAYLCVSGGRFSKLYTCFSIETGEELTVKVVRKSRWPDPNEGGNSNRSGPATHLGVAATAAAATALVESPERQKRNSSTGPFIFHTTTTNNGNGNGNSPDLFTATSTSPRQSPSSISHASSNDNDDDASDVISLDETRQDPRRQSHYLNHPHRNQLQEYALLKELQHSSILKVKDLMEDSRHFFCVTEWYDPTQHSLHAYMNQNDGPLPEQQAAGLFFQILSCLHYCHQRHIVHCNLKLDAFVVYTIGGGGGGTTDGGGDGQLLQIKLTDFAHAVVLCDLTNDYRNAPNLRLMEPRGSIRYMAPEVVTLDKSYASKCDVWSCGIILYVMLSNRFPLDGSVFQQVQAQVLATVDDPLWLIHQFRRLEVWTGGTISDEAKHMVHRLLSPLEEDRPTAEHALQHPWMQPYWMGSSEGFTPHEQTAPTTTTTTYPNQRTDSADSFEEATEALSNEYALQYHQEQHSHQQRRPRRDFVHSNDIHSSSFLTNSTLSQPHLERIEELSHVDSTGQLSTLSSMASMASTALKRLFPAPPQNESGETQKPQQQPQQPQQPRPSSLLPHQEEAVDAFVASHDRIFQEWQEADTILRASSGNTIDLQKPLSRQNIRQAYQLLFHSKLLDEDLNKVFADYDAEDCIRGLDFFVAVLNEKELLFTHGLHEAFKVFDTDHGGLVGADILTSTLNKYSDLLSDAADTTSASNGGLHLRRKATVARTIASQIDADAIDFEKGLVTLEELVAIILEAAIPKPGGPIPDVGDEGQQQARSGMSPQGVFREVSSPPPVSFVKMPSPSLESAVSGASNCSVASRRQSSLVDRLSLKFSAKHFIAQRPGVLSHYYELTDFVNEGGCGAVWFCTHKETGAERAVKLVRKTLSDADYNKRIMDEFLILRELDHPNILRQYELFEDPNFFYIVMDAARGGDLCDELDDFGAFIEPAAASFMKQLLSCINYLHSSDIVHCDLKPENILLEANKELSQLKVIDFGFAANIKKAKNQRLTKKWGTLQYSAPEVFAGNYGKKVDMWSAGVICFLLLSDEFPFWEESKEEMIRKVSEGIFSFSDHWDDISDLGKDFVSKLLVVDEDKRLSSEEALCHPWIQETTQRMWSELKQEDFDVTVTALTNLVYFSANSKLKQAAYSMIASQFLLKSEKESIDVVFRRLDTLCNGKLTRTEIQLAIRNFLGTDLSNKEVDELFLRVDVASTGFIEYSEFVMAAMDEDSLLSSGKLKSAFDSFDVDKTGFITSKNLKDALVGFLTGNEEMDAGAIAIIVDEVDTNGDGVIQYDEFAKAMSSRVEAAF